MSPIDLTSLSVCKAWLAINGAPVPSINTLVPLAIPAGAQTVTPTSMAGITQGTNLAIDDGLFQEIVNVSGVTGTTFTATFAISHEAGASVVAAADAIIPDIITAASLWFHRQTGRGPMDNSIPTASPFLGPVDYNEWYDGSGGNRLAVRNWPVSAVSLLQVNGVTMPQSTQPNTPGWVIDGDGKFISFRTTAVARGYGGAGWVGTFGGWNRSGCNYSFAEGIQNVNVQYTAGFQSLPADILRAITEMVGLTLRDRTWIGLKTEALAQAGGSTAHVDFVIPKRAQIAVDYYSRRTYS